MFLMVTHSGSHWSTQDTMVEYVDMVLAPYMAEQRQIFGLSSDVVGLCIFDVFTAHRCDCFLEKLDACGIKHVFVPAGSLQPLDVSINEPFKQHLKEIFSNWYAEQVKNSQENDDLVKVDLTV